jgi:hypothetical protein
MHGLGGARSRLEPERQFHGAEPDVVAVGQANWPRDRSAIQLRAVLAPEILDRGFVLRNQNPGVMTRYTG